MKDNRNEVRRSRIFLRLAAVALIAVAATPSAAVQPNEKGCPGEITWDSFVRHVLIAFGFNPGEHIQDNCL